MSNLANIGKQNTYKKANLIFEIPKNRENIDVDSIKTQ